MLTVPFGERGHYPAFPFRATKK